MDSDDLLDTRTSWVQCQCSGLCVGLGGDWGQTPWAFMHHANLLLSRCTLSFYCCCFICVWYWGGAEMFSSRSGNTLMSSNQKYILAGVEPVLIGTQRERLDRHYAGKCTCSVFCDIYFGICCLEICDYTDADPH